MVPDDSMSSVLRRSHLALWAWFDTRQPAEPHHGEDSRIDWLRIVPFVGLHAGCLAVLWFGWSPTAVVVAVGL